MTPKRSVAMITLWFILVASGCASVPMAPDNVQTIGRQFAPPANKARIHVVRPGQFGKGGAFIGVRVDGRFIGKLQSETFIAIDVEPGGHEVSGEWAGTKIMPDQESRKPSQETAKQNLLPGKCYFFMVQFGAGGGIVKFSVIPDEEGRRYVKDFRRVESSRVSAD
jgi:hypothetical protein